MAPKNSANMSLIEQGMTNLTLTETTSPTFTTRIPFEIRRQIFGYVFRGSAMIVENRGHIQDCATCGAVASIADTSHHSKICKNKRLSIGFKGPANYRVLLTSKSFHVEGRLLLASSIKIYIDDLAHLAAAQLKLAASQNTFLKFALPHIKDAYFQHEPNCWRLLTGVRSVELGPHSVQVARNSLSSQQAMEPDSDARIVERVKAYLRQQQGFKQLLEHQAQPFKLQIVFHAYIAREVKCYAFTYDAINCTISDKHMYQIDHLRYSSPISTDQITGMPWQEGYGFQAVVKADRDGWEVKA